MFSIWNLITGFGLISNKLLQRLIHQNVVENISETKIPCNIVVTNIDRGRQEVFSSENPYQDIEFSKIVTASACFPFAFTCVKIGKDRYADGGISENFAIDFFHPSAKVIGVHAGRIEQNFSKIDSIIHYPLRMVSIMMAKINQQNIEDAGLAFVVELDGFYNNMNLMINRREAKNLIDSGYRGTLERLKEM